VNPSYNSLFFKLLDWFNKCNVWLSSPGAYSKYQYSSLLPLWFLF